MKLSNFKPLGNTSSLIAGEAIARKDLLEVDAYSGKAFKVKRGETAGVGQMTYGTAQTSEATGRIVAQTSVLALLTPMTSRKQVLINASGEIFILSSFNLSNEGVKLSKFNLAGALLNSVTLVTSGVTQTMHLLELANGNIACVYSGSGLGNCRYAVYDSNLAQLRASTVIASIAAGSSHWIGAVVLAAGGFAVLWHDGTTVLDNKLATFDNSGIAVLAATTIWTRTGTSGLQYHRIAQLSDGNLAVAIGSANTVSSIGLYYAVITTAGVIVQAFTNLDTASVANIPDIAIISGFFAVGRANATAYKGGVFSNAGAAQGTALTLTSGAVADINTKLLSDGTAFWIIWPDNADSSQKLTKLPVTGAAAIVTKTVTTSPSQYGLILDAFYKDGAICVVTLLATSQLLWVIDTATGQLLNAALTTFGVVAATTGGSGICVAAGPDRSFIAFYNQSNVAASLLTIGKYINTAIVGVAQVAAAAEAQAQFHAAAGVYETTLTAGVTSKAIDQSANAVVGQKGTIMQYGAVLKGVGV